MIYLYAITEPLERPPAGPGLQEAGLELLHGDGLSAVYSAHDEIRCEADPSSLWRHELVVEEAMRSATALPARFGTTFPDADSLAAALVREGPRLRQALERVRGCVELAVRVGLPAAPREGPGDAMTSEPQSDPTEPADGRVYLRRRLAAQGARQSAMRRLEPLDEVAVASMHGGAGGPASAPLRASYLVRRDDVERFADELRRLEREEDELSFSCTGPWAPYSFVGEGAR